VYEDNDYDVYWMRLGISKSDPLQEKRNRLLDKLSISSTSDFSIRKGAKPIDGQLLAFLRIFNMNEGKLIKLKQSNQSLAINSFAADVVLIASIKFFPVDQLDHWITSDKSGDLEYIDCALDTALETKSWCFLQARLKLLLSTYKTTLEEDEKLIAEARVSPNRLLAIKMRATEKRIIRETLEYVEQYTKH
jgi:histone-lysine N-methyltransferase SETD3